MYRSRIFELFVSSYIVKLICLCLGISGGKSSLDRPSPAEPAVNCILTQAKPCAPILDAQSFAIKRKPMVVSLVSALFMTGSPTAIARLIIFVIVDSIKGVLAAGSRSHVRIKIGERFPSLAHPYPASTIILVLDGFRIIASLIHGIPCAILDTFRELVPRIPLSKFFKSQTAATSGMSRAKLEPRNDGFFSAIASAAKRKASQVSHAFHYRKAIVLLSWRDMIAFGHGQLPLFVTRARAVNQHRTGSLYCTSFAL